MSQEKKTMRNFLEPESNRNDVDRSNGCGKRTAVRSVSDPGGRHPQASSGNEVEENTQFVLGYN